MTRSINYPMINFVSGGNAANTHDAASLNALGGGLVNVTNNNLQNNSIIMVNYTSGAPATSYLEVNPITPGSNTFTIRSSNNVDGSQVNWFLISPTSLSMAGQSVGIPFLNSNTFGKVTLVGGTATVSSPLTPTSSINIFLGIGDVPPVSHVGAPFISFIAGGTGFTITSTDNLDNATIYWFILLPTNTSIAGAPTGGLLMLDATPATATYGNATLVAGGSAQGSVVVNTSTVTANSIILSSISVFGSNNSPGYPHIHQSKIIPGTSFVIDSTNSNDNSIVNWLMLEPSNSP